MERGGEGKFFKKQLGFCVEDSKLKYEYMTTMYFEILIATELLHCSHREFKDLPKIEQRKLMLFYDLKMDREEYFGRERIRKDKAEAKAAADKVKKL